MKPFKTKDFCFQIPSSFDDLKMDDLKFIQENIKDDVKIIERLTRLDIETLSKIDLTPIIETLDFLNEPLKEIEPKQLITIDNNSFLLPEDITIKTWYQQIEAFKAYQNGDRNTVIAVYLEPIIRGKKKPKPKRTAKLSIELDKLTVSEFFGCFNYLEKQIETLSERLNNMPKPKITPEQIEAGAEKFNVLGDFVTIDNIARDYSKTHNEVLLWSYSIIFNILYKNNLNSIFESRYSDIMQKKSAQK